MPATSSNPEYHYRAYGLTIRSEVPIAELVPEQNLLPDLVIRRMPVAGPMPRPDEPRLIMFDAEGVYLAWQAFGRFRVEASGAISADLAPGSEAIAGLALLGPVLAAYLHLRDTCLLHGSAIAFHGKAMLFLGAKGAGKSTLAAAMVAAGCRLINDDIIPITLLPPKQLAVIPGFPGLKLSQGAHEALLPDAAALPVPAEAAAAKRRISVGATSTQPLPIAAIFLLGDRTEPGALHSLVPTAALGGLLKQLYVLKFGTDALQGASVERLFHCCVRIARNIPIWSLRAPEGLEELRTFAEHILKEQSELLESFNRH